MDEAFGFAIRARSVRAGEEVAETVALTSSAEEMGAIAAAVVAHDPLGLDAEGSEVSQGALEEEDSAVLVFVGHDLSKGEAGSVIDADMDIFPAGPAHLVTPVVGDAVTGTDDAAELFDVEVEEFPGMLTLVAYHGRSRLQGAQPSEPVAAEQARNGGAGESALPRDLETGQTQAAQSEHDRHLSRRSRAWTALRARRAILQARGALGPETGDPFAHATFRKTDLESSDLGRELTRKDGPHDPFSTPGSESGISMNVHALGLGACWFAQPQLLNSQSHEQPIDTSHLAASGRVLCPVEIYSPTESDRQFAMRMIERLRDDRELCQRIAKTRQWQPETIRGLALEGYLGWNEGKLAFVYDTGIKLRWRKDGERIIRWAFGKPWLWRGAFLKFASTVYLCEGETDAISLIDAGVESDRRTIAVALPSASTFDRSWAELFKGKEVILAFDHDRAGTTATRRVSEVLSPQVQSLKQLHWEGMQYAS